MIQNPESETMNLLGRRVFAGVTKVLKVRSSWIIQGALTSIMSIFRRNRRGYTKQKTKRRGRQALACCSYEPRNTWSHQELEEARKYSFLGPWEGALPLASRLREIISVVLTHQVCSFVMAATGNSVIKHSVPTGYLLKSTFINYQVWFSWDHWVTGPHSLA